MYHAILAKFPETREFYTVKKHQNWCSGKERTWRKRRQEEAAAHGAPQAPEDSASADLLRAMSTSLFHLVFSLVSFRTLALIHLRTVIEYASPLLSWYGYANPGPTFFVLCQWAGEAGVSVGTMADAIHQLCLLHASNLPVCLLTSHLCLLRLSVHC